MIKAHCAIMSLGCDYLSTFKPTSSFTSLQSPHQIPIWTHHYPGTIPHHVHVHCGLCYPLPVSAIFHATEIHLHPVLSDGQICYLGVRMGPSLDNIYTLDHWPCG